MGRIARLVALGCWAGLAGLGHGAENGRTTPDQNAGWKLLFGGKSPQALSHQHKDRLNPHW